MRKLSWKIFPLVCLAGILFLGGCGGGRIKNNNLSGDIGSNNLENTSKKAKEFSDKPVKILFLGDMMFDRYIREAVEKYGKGSYSYAFEPVKDTLSQFDLVVGNLEGPITDKKSVSVGTAMDEKKNFVFTFNPAVAKVLYENNIKLVNLGNNHILNQSEEGLAQTEKYLKEAGVEYFGDTGEMEVEPPRGGSTSKVLGIGGIKIGFVNYNYSEVGSFERAIEEIKNIRAQVDIVIVYPHWGTEFKIGDPGQTIRNLAYKFVDAGADLVVGTHPHVVQTNETYKGKKIYYSLGNFVFDQYFQKETMEGLGVEVLIKPDLAMEYNELKFEMTKRGQTVFKVEP